MKSHALAIETTNKTEDINGMKQVSIACGFFILPGDVVSWH
jgi:hypothetical protein